MIRKLQRPWSLVVAVMTLSVLALGSQAQDTTRSDVVSEVPAAAEKTSEKASPKPTFRGRLPAYFSAVVTSKQRQEIYALQARYHEKIVEMLEQIEDLKKERDKAVDGQLTAAQLAAVQQKRDAAAAKRAERQATAGANEGSER